MFNQTRQYLATFDNQHEFERLAADVLNSLGYENVEPMAPLGGADGGIDILYTNGNAKGIAFVTLRKDIRKKFIEDLSKYKKNSDEIALFSIVDISPKQKAEFTSEAINKGATLEIFDIERIRSLFDSTLKELRRRYLGIDDDISVQIKDRLNKLIKFKNTEIIEIKAHTILETMFQNKLPQNIFYLLISYELNSLKEVPKIGSNLKDYLHSYDSFIGKLLKNENILITQIGKYEKSKFRESWIIHYKYSIMRFNDITSSDIQNHGSFLNYGITWESAERVFQCLLQDKTLETLIRPINTEYDKLIDLCLDLTKNKSE